MFGSFQQQRQCSIFLIQKPEELTVLRWFYHDVTSTGSVNVFAACKMNRRNFTMRWLHS